jgi:hypothetical protein
MIARVVIIVGNGRVKDDAPEKFRAISVGFLGPSAQIVC